jgi:hypothetical protein
MPYILAAYSHMSDDYIALHRIIEEAHGWMAAGYAPLSELFAAAAGSVNN